MSSSSECGAMTNNRSIGVARAFIFRHWWWTGSMQLNREICDSPSTRMSDFDPNVSARDTARTSGPLSMRAMRHDRRWVGTIFAITLLCAAATAMNAQSPAEPGVDASVNPGDDFFAYANG